MKLGSVNLWVSSILVRGLDADIFSIESQKFLVRFYNQTQPISLRFLFLNKLGFHYFLRSLHSLGRDVKIFVISDF